jgi:threonine dehydrogenase-like Zn-dependent dehydrogenase
VLLVGRHPERMEPLAHLDIETTRSGEDSGSVVRQWMPTAVIDTVQSDEAFDEYVDALPPRTGQIVFSGHSPDGTTAWANMERMQQNELTASFVSGWAPDRIEGTLELMRTGRLPVERFAVLVPGSELASTMRTVAEGRLRPVAAVLDWRELAHSRRPR